MKKLRVDNQIDDQLTDYYNIMEKHIQREYWENLADVKKPIKVS